MESTPHHHRPDSDPAHPAAHSATESTATPRREQPSTPTDSRRHRPVGGSPTSAIGQDELNLVDFPIGVLKYQQPTDAQGRRLEELVFTVDAFDKHVGTVVPKKVTIRTSSQHGFPTPKEEELLIGLMHYCRRRNNFTEARASFQVSEMLRVLGWPDNGRSRKQLRDGLDRLDGVRLKFENSWQSEEGKDYEREFNTGILDSYEFNVARDGEGTDSREQTTIVWAAEVFADIRRGNIKELNTDEFRSLKFPLSRRIYRFLNKHLQPGKWFEMDLLRFSGHLGISEKRHIGKIRERLQGDRCRISNNSEPCSNQLTQMSVMEASVAEHKRASSADNDGVETHSWSSCYEMYLKHQKKRRRDRSVEDTASRLGLAEKIFGDYSKKEKCWAG